ncbi:MAG: tyrosine-protein phosphatase [Ilumatobacteraceae bacterium]
MSPQWIDLEGANNVRDLGGLRAGGRLTRTGVLLRSDALNELTAGDVRHLVDERGLAHVVDLRSAHERIERGRGPLGDTPVRYTEVEVIGPDDLARRAEARAAAFAAGLAPERVLGDGYVELLELGGDAFTAAFRRILEPGGAPALVHCAIGKDRTGVLVALLLDVAGVDRDEIVADYARTGERMAPVIARWMDAGVGTTIDEQVAAFSAMAAPATMEQVLDVLADRWGGAAGFFAAHGVGAADLDRWRSMLVG